MSKKQYKYKSSAVAEMGDHLATVDIAQKVGAAVFFHGDELGPHLTHCCLGQGLPLYQVASSSIQLFGHNTPTLHIRQTGKTGEWSRSIGQTVTSNGRPKAAINDVRPN